MTIKLVPVSHNLTKWPEIFATFNQLAYTIAKLLVEKIISRHGVPSQLLLEEHFCQSC